MCAFIRKCFFKKGDEIKFLFDYNDEDIFIFESIKSENWIYAFDSEKFIIQLWRDDYKLTNKAIRLKKFKSIIK